MVAQGTIGAETLDPQAPFLPAVQRVRTHYGTRGLAQVAYLSVSYKDRHNGKLFWPNRLNLESLSRF